MWIGIGGLLIVDSRRALVARNTVSGSRGYGIPVLRVDDSAIRDNTLDGNDHGILNDGGSRDTIQRNSVSHSGGSAIDIGAANNRIVSNRLTANGEAASTNAAPSSVHAGSR